MPRTKAARKIKQEQFETSNDCNIILKKLEVEERRRLHILEADFNKRKLQIELAYKEEKLHWRKIDVNKSVAELAVEKSLCDATSTQHSIRKSSRKLRSSRSAADDEGYLTAGSVRSISSTRTSRTQTKETVKKGRQSRSLSRTNIIQSTRTAKVNSYKTPLSKQQFAIPVITPKVKMNTPQVLLRRPKQGEMAVSLQGSPLMVTNVLSDQECTVNIPCGNGGLWAIQPMKGALRKSQMPAIDHATQKQLEVLRENINKICAMQCSKK